MTAVALVRTTVPRRRFGPASEEPYRRRPSDLVRVVVAVALVAVLASRAHTVSDAQRALFESLNDLPGNLRSVARVLYGLGGLWAAGLVAAAALVARRFRLARDLLLAAALAWLTARALALGIGGDLRHQVRAIVRARVVPGFPAVQPALITAVVSAAAPYVTRPTRWLGRAFVLLLAPTALYLGVALPASLLGALLLGWGVAALVHLALGSPGGRPTAAQVQASLHDLGVLATHVRLAEEQPRRYTAMMAELAGHDLPLRVKVLGRDETDARLVAKAWRFVAYRDSGPTLYLTRAQEVEHEAYAVLLARTAGVCVPAVLAAGTGGPRVALLVEEEVPGPRLADLREEAAPSDVVLDAVWEQVRRLHEVRVAHGHLNAARVVIGEQGPTLVGFGTAMTAAPDGARAEDIAELMATTAPLVGVERAVAAATRALGRDAVARVLPLLQPGALSRDGRRLAGSRSERGDALTAVRGEVARVTDVAVPQLERLHRITRKQVLLAVAVLLGLGGLLGQVSDPAQLLTAARRADPLGLALAVALGVASWLSFAMALSGSVRARLPLLPNLRVQLAGALSQLALPFGSAALQIRFLQRQGVDLATAVSAAGFIATFGLFVAQVGVFAVATAASPHPLTLAALPTGTLVTLLEVGVAAVLVVTVLVFAVRPLRQRFVPPITRGAGALRDVVTSPRQVALLLGGNALATVLSGLVLAVALRAFHQDLSVWTAVALATAVTGLASLVPVPSGGTAVSSVGLSGALIALGVPAPTAVAVVLVDQLAATFLPAVPGVWSLRTLVREDDL